MAKSNDNILALVSDIKLKLNLLENDLLEFNNEKAKKKAKSLVYDIKLLRDEL